MATTSLWPIHNTGGRGVRKILNKLVEYAENEEKTKEGSGGGGSARSNPEIMQSVMGYAARSDKVSAEKDAVQAIPSEEESKEEMKQVLGIRPPFLSCGDEMDASEANQSDDGWQSADEPAQSGLKEDTLGKIDNSQATESIDSYVSSRIFEPPRKEEDY